MSPTALRSALRPDHVVVNLEGVLGKAASERARMLKDEAKCELTGAALDQLKAAKSLDELLEALSKRLSARVKGTVPAGSMYLQPTEERRRTGSHYTPRSLTEPIVRTTLRPILEAMGERPRPEQILDLKVCDPAMGSGAFLVEVCRLLGDRLVEAWQTHRCVPQIPPDEDLHLYARRMVAQTCLYGVDKNPFAVDLAKLSLWLTTLAKDHPFTFLDHALREGDSLVGLSREQIACFHWAPEKQLPTIRQQLDSALVEAETLRHQIQELAKSDDTVEKARLLREADEAVANLRLVGNLAIAAFFGGEKKADRERLRDSYADKVQRYFAGKIDRAELSAIAAELASLKSIHPFHWQIEFPEVFSRQIPGFDAFVGNPPFGGKNSIINSNRENYLPYLQEIHEQSHGNSDLVAHFFRRAFNMLRKDGAFGLIATNTIAQGDTRSSGLRWICTHGGAIFAAQKRYKWPAGAAVIVSTVHVVKGHFHGQRLLDGKPVGSITAFLFHHGGQEDPSGLHANAGKSFQGSIVLGVGFTFEDNNPDANALSEMHNLIRSNPRNQERIFPYIGGEEINDSPTQSHDRFVINFGQLTLEQARAWPDLLSIVEEKVKPVRLRDKREAYRKYWWQFAEKRSSLYDAVRDLDRVLAISIYSNTFGFTFLPSRQVFSNKVLIFSLSQYRAFTVLQSRIHEVWARFFSGL